MTLDLPPGEAERQDRDARRCSVLRRLMMERRRSAERRLRTRPRSPCRRPRFLEALRVLSPNARRRSRLRDGGLQQPRRPRTELASSPESKRPRAVPEPHQRLPVRPGLRPCRSPPVPLPPAARPARSEPEVLTKSAARAQRWLAPARPVCPSRFLAT